MENLKWRKGTRIVAIIDAILSVLVLVVIGCLLIGASVNPEVTHRTAALTALWIVLSLFAVVVILNVWAAITLLNATKLGGDPQNAIHRATIWGDIGIAFFLVWAILNLIASNYLALIIGCLVRGAIIFVACKFLSELEGEIGTSDKINQIP